MARKTGVPADQLDRLKQLYNEQRDALVALATADDAVTEAQALAATAEHAVKDAQAEAESAYQALVDLMGAGAAAELTGRRTPTRRGASARKTQTDQTHQGDDEHVADGESAPPATVGAMSS